MSLPLPPQNYSADDQAQTRAQIARQLMAQQAQLQTLSATTQAYPVWDLRHYASLAGISLGQGNDQAAIDLVHGAMQAAVEAKAPLYVWVPPGEYDVDFLHLFNWTGWYADPGTVLIRQKAQTTPRPIVSFGTLDQYDGTASSAGSWVLWGLRIDGRWTPDWTNEEDPGLFHYAASEDSASDPDRNAIQGQAGVLLRNVFAELQDLYHTGSLFSHGVYEPTFLIGHLEIYNVAGDGFSFMGSGGGVAGPIRTWQTGGRGININGYDTKWGPLDAGASGLEAIVLRAGGASMPILAKGWFSGQRPNAGNIGAGGLAQDAGHTQGVWIDRGSNISGFIQAQDTVGSAFKIGSIYAPQLILNAGWQAVSPSAQTVACGGIDFVVARYQQNACTSGSIDLTLTSGLFETGPYPQVQYALNADGPVVGTSINITQLGLPGDTGGDLILTSWLLGGSNLDSCRISFGVAVRAIPQWLPDSTGVIRFGLPVDGSLAGVLAETSGQAGLLAAGRGVPMSLGIYDPATSVYRYPFYSELDGASGAIKAGLFGACALQPTPTGNISTPTPGSGAAAHVDTTFTGGLGPSAYTLGDVVLALKQLGLLAL